MKSIKLLRQLAAARLSTIAALPDAMERIRGNRNHGVASSRHELRASETRPVNRAARPTRSGDSIGSPQQRNHQFPRFGGSEISQLVEIGKGLAV
jgi:hypothetical protein